jgi:hypothetical protein
MQLLKGCVELDVPMGLMGIVLTAFPEEHPGVPISVWRYTFGPLIVHVPHAGEQHDLGWLGRDAVTRWRPRVDLERLEILTGERDDLISPAELWLVMYNAVHSAPLGHSLTQIYLWAAQRAYRASGKPVPEDLYKDPNWCRLQPTDGEVFDGHLTHEYREICRAVIRKVVQYSTILRETRRPREPVAQT